MRVHELAKELKVTSRELLDRLSALGYPAKNHMSALDERAVQAAREALAPAKPAAPPPQPSPPPRMAPAPAPSSPPVSKPVQKTAEKTAAPTPTAPKAPPPAPPTAGPTKPPITPTPAPAHQKITSAAPPPAQKITAPTTVAAKPRVISIKGPILVKELADLLGIRPNRLISELMKHDVFASINQRLDHRVAVQVAEEMGFEVEKSRPSQKPTPKDWRAEPDEDRKPENLQPRPPVVTFLGHVDHGKTSLLDRIRNTAVAQSEAGGITQHVGAYTVESKGHRITFLDTPGHQAFTAMRARGANMTDIAVIVVAADDGVMPQTTEAIQHATAAKVPIMVAINKVDLPAANVQRVKQQLASMGLTPEDWGGNVICSEVSALTGQGLEHLLEMILLQAEIMEIKADPTLRAKGFVIEAKLEPGRGPTANLLVKEGTLHTGDALLCGSHWGRVRALIDDHGRQVASAGPSMPVQCLGLSGVPGAGAPFRVCADERVAREMAEAERSQIEQRRLTVPKRASLDALTQTVSQGGQAELRLVLKADVQGSIEAIEHALRDIRSDKVTLEILASGVGSITANDVLLASASDAIIVGFHVGVDAGVSRIAKQEGVEILLHSIIYELQDRVREAMTGLLAPIVQEQVTGHAVIKQVFNISKAGVIAGCQMSDGVVSSKSRVRVKRGSDVIYEGVLASLRRFQNDVSEVREGQECGIRLDNFAAFAPGDVLEFYEVRRIAQSL